MNKKILIFRHTPIDVDIKMYEYFAQHLWNGGVVVYAETTFKEERVICNYKEEAAGIQTIIIDKSDIVFDDDFFVDNRKEIFIFYGIVLANKYIHFLKKHHIEYAIISERDISINEVRGFKKFVRKFVPMYQFIRNGYLFPNLKCLIAFGQGGVKCFNKYFCIPKKILFGFMYNDGNDSVPPKPICDNAPVKFVYVGRMDYRIKGVDILLSAFQDLNGNFTLDLIGSYGNNLEDIKIKIQNISNARLLGACDKDKLCKVMNEYDVIIVPSRIDGWNLHCNLSINAGLGAIVTDQSGSEELIQHCGNGEVIPAGDIYALQVVAQRVIDNPLIVNEWKKKTGSYVEKISYKIVAKYFYDILNYSFGDTKRMKRPVCPWLQ